MPTITESARPRQPRDARTSDTRPRDVLADACVPIAAQLVATVHDYDPADTAAILDPLTPARWYRLCIILAAMVDPDRTPSELLAWIGGPTEARDRPPVGVALPREHGTERGYQQHRHRNDMPACQPCLIAHRAHGRPATETTEAA